MNGLFFSKSGLPLSVTSAKMIASSFLHLLTYSFHSSHLSQQDALRVKAGHATVHFPYPPPIASLDGSKYLPLLLPQTKILNSVMST